MDFIFQDNSADIIRRELMAPRPAIEQSLIQAEPSKRYVKMAQICIATIDDPHSPGGNSLGCKKETTRQRPVNIGNGNPAINPHPQGNFEPVNLEDVLNEELTECKREQTQEAEVDSTARDAQREIMTRSDWRRREYGAFIYSGPNGIRLGEIFEGDEDSVDLIVRTRPGETIVGRIHNHPRGGVGAPSDTDIDGVNELISRGYVDENNFSDYIIDANSSNPETNLSEFDEPQNGTPDRPNNDTRADARGEC